MENENVETIDLYSPLKTFRVAYKERIFISTMPLSSPNSTFDLLLESSHRYDSNKMSNIGFSEGITQAVSFEVSYTVLVLIKLT